MYDIAIVGGGPGGLQAGRRLAARGFRVGLFEEHETIGEPVHCTGVLADEAFDEFEVARNAILNEIRTARFFSPDGDEIEYTTPQVEAVVIDRVRFDRDLHDAATAAGVDVIRGSRVSDIKIARGGVSIVVGGRVETRARACILACGASYGIQRRLGLGMPSVFHHSAQVEMPAERPGQVEIHFGSEIAPGGFCWAVPVRRGARWHVRIGVMCEGNAAEYFDRAVRSIGPRWGGRMPEGTGPRLRILPLSPIDRTYADRVLAIGDAAGLVKPTTGGGIYYSLLSADIAASVLGHALQRNDTSADALREYEVQWRRRLSGEIEAQRALRVAAERLTDREINALFALTRVGGLLGIVRRTARFNQHRQLITALFKHTPARQILLRQLAG